MLHVAYSLTRKWPHDDWCLWWRKELKQVDNESLKEALKAAEAKVESIHERNDSELQSIRELIEVRLYHQRTPRVLNIIHYC